MTNPFEAFNVSDDEEDTRVNVVKGEEKTKRSNFSSIQPTKRRESTRNSKKRPKIITIHLNLPLSTSLSPKEPNNLALIPTWREIRKNTKLKSSPQDIIMTDNPALADSKTENYLEIDPEKLEEDTEMSETLKINKTVRNT